MKVLVVWEFEADVDDLDTESIDIPGLARDLAKREMEYNLKHEELTADDFEYLVEGNQNMHRQELKNTDTQGHNTYVVAQCCGGVMEDPDIHYENYQIIRADSKWEAEEKYNKLNHCSYYYGSVVHTIHEESTIIADERGRAVLFDDRRQRPLADPMSQDISRELYILEKWRIERVQKENN